MVHAQNVEVSRLRTELIRPGGLWSGAETLATTGSTNADLADAARAGAASGTILVAEHQSAGRGRFDRVWEAPPGKSLAISVLLRPPLETPPRRWLWLPLVAGMAVADGVLSASGLRASLKWPNDVLIGAKKLCGILAERVEGESGPAVVIGMGINTSLGEDELPAPTATSLLLAGAEVDPTALVVAVLDALSTGYSRWLAGADLRAEYESRCSSVGTAVRVQSLDTQAEGIARGVDADGCLLVDVDGRQTSFAAGDVFHLR